MLCVRGWHSRPLPGCSAGQMTTARQRSKRQRERRARGGRTQRGGEGGPPPLLCSRCCSPSDGGDKDETDTRRWPKSQQDRSSQTRGHPNPMRSDRWRRGTERARNASRDRGPRPRACPRAAALPLPRRDARKRGGRQGGRAGRYATHRAARERCAR